MLGNQRVVGGHQPLEQPQGARVLFFTDRDSGIPQRHARIAHQAAPFRAFYGAASKNRAEFLLRKRTQPFEFGRRKGSPGFDLTRLKRGQVCDRRLAIPRAHILSDIAADDGAAHLRA